MKRKEGESSFEFRQRVKKAKYKKKHQYDQEKEYWNKFHKNPSKRATEQNRNLIHDLFGHKSMIDKLSIAGTGDVNQNPQRERTWSEFGRQAVATAAGATLGFINMNVPGAIIGGTFASRAAAPDLEDVMDVNSSQNKLIGHLMPGTYQGKFALSAKQSSKGLRDKYQKKGAVYLEETYGTVADPDCVYIGHSSYSRTCIASAIGLALLRKLFRVGVKFDPTTIYEELPLISAEPDSGPDGFVIVYITKNSGGTEVKKTHDIPNDFGLLQILNHLQNDFKLFDNILGALEANNVDNLTKVLLYQKNGSAFRLHYQMDLAKEVLSVAMSSHMVIQNRTKSASGAANTTEVDAQPLKGPVYEFSSGVPKLKAASPDSLNYMRPEGIILVRTNQLAGTDPAAYREVPAKNAFQNVVKSGYTRLNPGALKSMTVGTDCTGYYNNVLFKLRINQQGVVSRCFGKSQMVILEEELNSGSTNLITISYECQHVAGADLTTTYSPNLQPGYISANINNGP